jgi:CheY-like chemotaxis protein
MDGLEVTRVLRQGEGRTGRHFPIVALTARAMKGDRERCLEAGMDAYLAKPVRPEELFHAIETLALRGPAGAGTPTSETQATSKDLLDRSAILTQVDGDRALLERMAEIFRDQCQLLLPQIREAMGRGDPGALADSAHALKGSVSHWHAPRAVQAARELEEGARKGEMGDAPRLVRLLEEEIPRVQKEIDKMRAEAGDEEENTHRG